MIWNVLYVPKTLHVVSVHFFQSMFSIITLCIELCIACGGTFYDINSNCNHVCFSFLCDLFSSLAFMMAITCDLFNIFLHDRALKCKCMKVWPHICMYTGIFFMSLTFFTTQYYIFMETLLCSMSFSFHIYLVLMLFSVRQTDFMVPR